MAQNVESSFPSTSQLPYAAQIQEAPLPYTKNGHHIDFIHKEKGVEILVQKFHGSKQWTFGHIIIYNLILDSDGKENRYVFRHRQLRKQKRDCKGIVRLSKGWNTIEKCDGHDENCKLYIFNHQKYEKSLENAVEGDCAYKDGLIALVKENY